MVRRLSLALVLAIACLTCLHFSGASYETPASQVPAKRTMGADPASRQAAHTPADADERDASATAGAITAAPTPARVVAGRDPAGTRFLRLAALVLTLVSALVVGRTLARPRESHLPGRHTLAIPRTLDLRGPPRVAASH